MRTVAIGLPRKLMGSYEVAAESCAYDFLRAVLLFLDGQWQLQLEWTQ
jgi:hypothetical protein